MKKYNSDLLLSLVSLYLSSICVIEHKYVWTFIYFLISLLFLMLYQNKNYD